MIVTGDICFRLLNSEIGNDPGTGQPIKRMAMRFRLLNSEIGNDLQTVETMYLKLN